MKNLIIFSSLLIFGILFTANQSSNAGFYYSGADSNTVCIVTGEEFPSEHGVKYKYLNKEVSFCCAGCVKAFQKEPANYLKDGLICPVCGEDDAKKDLSTVAGGIKYYFCSAGCKKKFEGDSQKYLDNYNK